MLHTSFIAIGGARCETDLKENEEKTYMETCFEIGGKAHWLAV